MGIWYRMGTVPRAPDSVHTPTNLSVQTVVSSPQPAPAPALPKYAPPAPPEGAGLPACASHLPGVSSVQAHLHDSPGQLQGEERHQARLRAPHLQPVRHLR